MIVYTNLYLNNWYYNNSTIKVLPKNCVRFYVGVIIFYIPTITPTNQPITAQIEALVDKILAITKDSDYPENPTKQAKVKEYEKQIDEMVYKLYNLTKDEIKIVEGLTNG